MLAKFHGNILNLNENIAKSFFGGLLFDSHCSHMQIKSNMHNTYQICITPGCEKAEHCGVS